MYTTSCSAYNQYLAHTHTHTHRCHRLHVYFFKLYQAHKHVYIPMRPTCSLNSLQRVMTNVCNPFACTCQLVLLEKG